MSQDVQEMAIESLHQIAPDIDFADIDRSMDLRDSFDIDSMDFLNLVTRVGKQLSIDIPENDYPFMVASFDAFVEYLENRGTKA